MTTANENVCGVCGRNPEICWDLRARDPWTEERHRVWEKRETAESGPRPAFGLLEHVDALMRANGCGHGLVHHMIGQPDTWDPFGLRSVRVFAHLGGELPAALVSELERVWVN